MVSLKSQSLGLLTLSCLTCLLAAPTPARAGFEWVPAPQTHTREKPTAKAPMMVKILPKSKQSGPAMTSRPMMRQSGLTPEPGLPPAPPPIRPEDAQTPRQAPRAGSPAGSPKTNAMKLLKFDTAEPKTQTPEPRMNVLTMGAEPPRPRPEPIEARKLLAQKPTALQKPTAPAVRSAPAPAASAPAKPAMPKIIMPEDAPEKAIRLTPGGEKLSINPFPNKTEPRLENRPAPAADTPPTAARPAPGGGVKEARPAPHNYAPVVGFGADMPLALALRQVVPASYAFSFGDGVNPGYRVSWNGGKPWNEVISEMVAPLKLRAVVSGNTVLIVKNDA